MNNLLTYYQKELHFLKQHGRIFSRRFPKIARRLGILDGETEDPHVSRLIESFALLTSRIHQRLDDDMPELTEALISVLAPQFLRTLPSVCIVMFESDPLRSGVSGRNRIEAGTTLLTRHNTGSPCQFQTAYPINLLPVSVNSASLCYDSDDLSWKLQLSFQVWPGSTLGDERIRLYLHGQASTVNIIYTLLCTEVSNLILKQNNAPTSLYPGVISQVGFDDEDAILASSSSVDPVHRLLFEYFWFPQKFSFVDVQLPAGFRAAGNTSFELQVAFKHNRFTPHLESLMAQVDHSFFQLHCTPAVNLFPMRAEPVVLTDSTADYLIVPDTRHHSHLDVWSVEKVSVQHKTDGQIVHVPLLPLLGNRPYPDTGNNTGLYWQTFRREVAGEHDITYKTFIAFSERAGHPPRSGTEIVSLNIIASNHEIPYQMNYGLPDGDFDANAPLAGLKITALIHPTRPIQPQGKSELHWRFLSLLSLNHQLLQGDSGVEQLKEILGLYRFSDNSQKQSPCRFMQSLHCLPITARIISHDPHSLARGISVTLTFSHDALLEPDYFLFCCMLDRLLALYAPVNSFTRLTTCIENEKLSIRIWPIRAGKLSWL